MGKKYKIVKKLMFLTVFTVLSLYLVFRKDYKDIIKVLSKASHIYVIFSIICMLLVFFIDGLILTLIANSFQKGYKLSKGIINQQGNVFFNGITPLASGGQPFQVYLFKKQGIKIENGIGIVFIHFLFYKFCLLSFALFSLIYNYKNLNNMTSNNSINLSFVLIVSFILISSLSILLILVAYLKIFQKLFHKIIHLLFKLKIIKNEDEAHNVFDKKLVSTRQNIKHIFTNYKLIFLLLFLMFLRFFIYYSIPYICFYAINSPIDKKHFIDCLSLSSFISLVSGIVPLPGGSVGVELSYNYLFSNFFNNQISSIDINSSLLVWRSITFYLGLILGALVVIFYNPRKKYNLTKNIKIDNKI